MLLRYNELFARMFYLKNGFMNLKKYMVTVLCLLSVCIQAKDITVIKLTAEQKSGCVVSVESPRLGWQLSSLENGTSQTAYELEVYNSWTDTLVWHTGKIKSDRSQLIPTFLKQGCYTWRVRVWDETDAVSEWSASAEFIVTDGVTSFKDSKWIGAITRKDACLPEGRIYTGAELKKPNVKDAWARVDSLAKKSILLRKEFMARSEEHTV